MASRCDKNPEIKATLASLTIATLKSRQFREPAVTAWREVAVALIAQSRKGSSMKGKVPAR